MIHTDGPGDSSLCDSVHIVVQASGMIENVQMALVIAASVILFILFCIVEQAGGTIGNVQMALVTAACVIVVIAMCYAIILLSRITQSTHRLLDHTNQEARLLLDHTNTDDEAGSYTH